MEKETELFTINCIMQKRWIPHFVAMLKYMEQLGNLGSSRNVNFYADGDGDFRPKFNFSENIDINNLPEPIKDIRGNRTYDAG